MHYEPEAMGCRVVRISFKSLSLMMWLELMNPLSVVALASSMLSGSRRQVHLCLHRQRLHTKAL